MTKIISINLNKRFNSQRPALLEWLNAHKPDVFITQEPWSNIKDEERGLEDYRELGGSNRVYCWYSPEYKKPGYDMPEPYILRIDLGYIRLWGVYLDAYNQSIRASQIQRIHDLVIADRDRPVIICGDFNMAPTSKDGLYDGRTSNFNSKIEREPFSNLCEIAKLKDLGISDKGENWTVQRKIHGKPVSFRCDLVLASQYIADEISFSYDHSVRSGNSAFTDHSALVIDVPVTLDRLPSQESLFGSIRKFHPEKTAMARRGPSPVARMLVDVIGKDKIESVLDYGCGRGEDFSFFRSLGIKCDGYDPHEAFGYSIKPKGKYSIVLLTFVLNVLSDPWQRPSVIKEAASYLSSGGFLVITTRSPAEISEQASSKDWNVFNDGYWSHETRGTFQRGISREEIIRLGNSAGLKVSLVDKLFKAPGRACMAVLSI